MKTIMNCFCNCHSVGIGFCDKCKRRHKKEWTTTDTIQNNKEVKQRSRFKPKRRRL